LVKESEDTVQKTLLVIYVCMYVHVSVFLCVCVGGRRRGKVRDRIILQLYSLTRKASGLTKPLRWQP